MQPENCKAGGLSRLNFSGVTEDLPTDDLLLGFSSSSFLGSFGMKQPCYEILLNYEVVLQKQKEPRAIFAESIFSRITISPPKTIVRAKTITTQKTTED